MKLIDQVSEEVLMKKDRTPQILTWRTKITRIIVTRRGMSSFRRLGDKAWGQGMEVDTDRVPDNLEHTGLAQAENRPNALQESFKTD